MKDRSLTFPLVGCLNEESNYVLSTEVFIDEKPNYYTIAGDTKKMTGAEVFAEFGSE